MEVVFHRIIERLLMRRRKPSLPKAFHVFHRNLGAEEEVEVEGGLEGVEEVDTTDNMRTAEQKEAMTVTGHPGDILITEGQVEVEEI